MRRWLIVLSALAVALVWAAVAGTVAVRRWAPTRAAIAAERDRGARGCQGRYLEADAQARCEGLFEVQYVMERNVAIFTRLLVALGPLAGVGLWRGSREAEQRAQWQAQRDAQHCRTQTLQPRCAPRSCTQNGQ